MSLLLAWLPLIPLVCAICALAPRARRRSLYLTGALGGCALALLLAVLPDLPDLRLPGFLLGTTFGVDPVGRALLLLATAVWLAATISALPLISERHGQRFTVCFLLTFAGNLGLLVAQDAASFYCWFALMTFAAYGLVIHEGSLEALRAGRIYLVLAIIGELFLLAGLFTLAADVGNPQVAELRARYPELSHPTLTAGLILAGFAVKVGVLPLHVWLPLAHPAAPVPASAVLSGVMLKAGLVGWIRLVPADVVDLPVLGLVMAWLGLAGAFIAAVIGCFQGRPKTVLAYSSVSQMGLMTTLVGLLLAGQGQAQALGAALAVFAVHHGLAKGALFLAVPLLQSAWRPAPWLTSIPALALAGAPLTSGAVTKAMMKGAVPPELVQWITLSSVTTSLLLIRFLVLVWPQPMAVPRAPWPPALLAWLGLLLASLLLPWWLAGPSWSAYALTPAAVIDGLWPVVVAAFIALLLGRVRAAWPTVPEGDVVVFAERWVTRLRLWWNAGQVLLPTRSFFDPDAWRQRPLVEPGFGLSVVLMLGLVLLLALMALRDWY